MSETYQVVAATPGRDKATVLRLVDAIGARFSVDLGSLIEALSETGVGVASAGSLAEARAMGADLITMGADYRVLDEQGEEVDAGDVKALVVESRKPSTGHRTMMGGFSAPELMEMAASKRKAEAAGFEHADGGFADRNSSVAEGAMDLGAAGKAGELELDGPGGFAHERATIGAGAVDLGAAKAREIEFDDGGGFAAADARIAEGALGLGAAKEREIEFDDGGGFAAPDSIVGVGAVGLGAAAAQPEGEIELDGPGGFADQRSTIADGAVEVAVAEQNLELDGPGGYSAPAKGFDLDALDMDALVMLDGSSDKHSAVSAKPSSSSKSPSPVKSKARVVDESSFLPPEQAGGVESPLELDDTQAVSPSKSPTRPPPPASASELEWMPADNAAAAPSTGAPSMGATSTSATDAAPEARPPRPRRAPVRSVPSGPLLLGGKLRSRPLARVAVGFVLALGLSSLLPMCHARSVRNERIEPLRVDLSTAKAHGSLLASTPGYRTPAQIESSIDSIRTRHGIATVMMWSALAALLLFLWFRFT